MKLGEIGDEYEGFSSRLSTLVRQLGLAGIAFVWVFSGPQTTTSITIPDDLTVVAIWLVAALSLDALQYAYGALAWGWLRRKRERKFGPSRDQEVPDPPGAINWPTVLFFWAKAGAVGIAYVRLGFALFDRLG